MLRGKKRNSRVGPALRLGPAAAAVVVRAALAAVAGLAVIAAVVAVPALAAQQEPSTTARQQALTGRVAHSPRWAHLAAGFDYSCGIRTDGTLWCWGSIGNISQDLPGQITTPAPGGWASITGGQDHVCATRTDGTLWCWGDNAQGQLGIGSHTGQNLPQQVTTPAREGWASVTAGAFHTCAIRAGGTLWCWGWNQNGQLGPGNRTVQDVPEQVVAPARGGWASVTAGFDFTCAIRTDHTLRCWGEDQPGQVTTPAPGGWASVTAGDDHTCATRTDGTLWCWGDNYWGQLGNGNHTDQSLPQQVTTPARGGWASVKAGGFHTCATRIDGSLWCWGDNDQGQLGIGNLTSQDLPRQVTTPARGGWASVTAGEYHTCATRTDGTLWCWGRNENGQLGNGNHTDQDLPRQVTCRQAVTASPPARSSAQATSGQPILRPATTMAAPRV